MKTENLAMRETVVRELIFLSVNSLEYHRAIFWAMLLNLMLLTVKMSRVMDNLKVMLTGK